MRVPELGVPGRRSVPAVLLLPLVLFLLPGCVVLSDRFAVSGEYWYPELDGDLRLSVVGTDLDVIEALDIDRHEQAPLVRVEIPLGPVLLELRYFELEFHGSTVLSRDIEFENQTFTVMALTTSDIDIRDMAAYLKFGVLDLSPLKLGVLVGVNYIDVDTTLKAIPPPVALEASDDIEVPVPVVGFTYAFDLPLGEHFTLFSAGDAAGLFGSYEEIDGKFLDFGARLGVRWKRSLTVGGGYRYFDVDFEESFDNDASVTLKGPFFFVELSF